VSDPCEQIGEEISWQTVRFCREGALGVLTLARPDKRNALSPAMLRELREVGERLAGPVGRDLRCLLITGEGPVFCAGLDLVEGMYGDLADWSERPVDERAIAWGLEIAGSFDWIPRLPFPSVAAVRGHAYGAGLQLTLACDFRIFAVGTLVGHTEIRFGLLPDMGATWRLPRIVGPALARELILFGAVIEADEARRTGLANRVVDAADLDRYARDFCARLADQPPLAVAGARRLLELGQCTDDRAALMAAIHEQATCLTSEDFREALVAHAERRAPRWRGC